MSQNKEAVNDQQNEASQAVDTCEALLIFGHPFVIALLPWGWRKRSYVHVATDMKGMTND